MKKLSQLAAIALLVAGSIACTKEPEPAAPSDTPPASATVESQTTTDSAATAAPSDTSATTVTAEPAPGTTDATATSGETSGTTSTQ